MASRFLCKNAVRIYATFGVLPKKKGSPAGAVCCKVLNLLSQVVSYRETPPWLEPIALFLLK